LLIFCSPNLYTLKVSLELTLNEANITNDPCIFIFRSLRYFQNLTKLDYHTRLSLIWFSPLITGGEPRCSRRVRSFSVLRDTRHGTHIVMYDNSMQNNACIFIFRSLRYFQNLTKLDYHTRCSLIWSYFDILISVMISA
jgi:hypothetical protein